MTDSPKHDPLANGPRVLDRKVRFAQGVIVFERVWRALAWPFAVLGFFLLATLGEVWSLLPPLAHQGGLIAFAFAFLASLVPLARVAWPDREEGLRRLEQVSGVSHRPATSFEDDVDESATEEQRALWTLHRRRLAETISRLTAGWPHPRLDKADPYALRAVLVLLLAIGFASAGDSVWQRMTVAFDAGTQDAHSRYRIDAWVTPPLYTGKAPVVLADGLQAQHVRQVTTPEKSLLLVRVNGPAGSRPGVQVKGASATLARAVEPSSNEEAFAEYKITVSEPVSVTVGSTGLAQATWHFDVIEDTAPSIELAEEPTRAPRGALRFTYRVEDDYGVAGGEARFALAGEDVDQPEQAAAGAVETPAQDKSGETAEKNKALEADKAGEAEKTAQAGKSADEESGSGGKELVFEPPVIPLNLPRANAKTAEGRTSRDLTSHPWAGLKVEMTLEARDHAGQKGASEPYEMVLPARKFTEPLAKAVIEQRKNLVRNPDGREPVARALDALTIAPERFLDDKVVYLGMRSAYWRLKNNTSDEGLRSVVKLLWDIALRIEDGDLPQAEADLKAAQEELRRALENGASQEEIARLVDKLRQAMNRFLQAMAEKARQNGDLAKMPEGLGPQQMLSNKDLEEMLRNIENLAKTGSREMAQRMLDQLSDMMQRLQMGQANPNSQSQQMMNTVQGLGEVIQRQQNLLDDTFKEQRQQPGEGRQQQEGRQGQPGQQGQFGQRFGQQGRQGRGGEGQQGQQGRQGQGQYGEGQGEQRGRGPGEGDKRYGALSNRQGGIRDRLDGLLEQLRTLGTRLPDQLEGAGRAMREAEKALEGEDLDRAIQQQTLALDRLRQGTQSVAEQVLQALSSRMGQGGQRNKDPFGRPEKTQGPDLGTSVKVPDEIDIQRAREILDELRKRLGDPTRPMLELDYLERLIEQF